MSGTARQKVSTAEASARAGAVTARSVLRRHVVDDGFGRDGTGGEADGGDRQRRRVPGIPVPLFTIRARGSQYDTKDGKRFLVNFEDVSSALPITVDLDWTRQLRR